MPFFAKLLGALAVVGLLSASQTVLAYTPPGDDYLCDEPMELKFYQYIRWQPYELPLKVYVPPIPYKMQQPGMYMQVLHQAFGSWTQVIPQFNFQFVDSPAKAQIQIKWVEHFPESEAMWGETMLPTPYFDAQNKLRHRSEIRLALRAQKGTGLGTDSPFFSAEELSAIATHEIGHALGLLHSDNPDDIMTSYLFRLTSQSKWAITPRDAATLRRLYTLPARVEIPPCNGS